jgi:alginate O-acetyltransferase complex protein AlgI
MLSWDNIWFYSQNAPLIFSQYLFLFIFTLFFFFFALLRNNIYWRNLYLFVFSLFFYYKSGGLYFWLLVISTLIDYGCGSAIHRSQRPWHRKFYLFVSLISNLGMLAFFKYSYFLVAQINTLFGTHFKAYNFLAVFANNSFGTNYDVFEIILPVGISFYTFQTLSYTIDIYRRQLEPARNIIDFGFFVSFFPQLVAGPIVRAADFLPQIYKRFSLSRQAFGAAIFLIMAGLFKKMVVSDYLSINFVDRVFADPLLYSGFMNLMAVYGYAIQIYCDFSGYSDMAIGLAALMGFQLPLNFNSPYKATSITDFWRRWHISLSTWLRDYLYISMGGNRKGKARTYLHLMITMLLGGLWHGAALRFIIWGGLHGLALAIHKLWMRYVPLAKSQKWWYQLAAGMVTFHFVCWCWIYFRAADVETVGLMSRQIALHFDWSGSWDRVMAYREVFGILLLGFLLHFFPTGWKNQMKQFFTALPLWAKSLSFALLILICFQAASSEIQPFIYFQF